MCTVRLLPPDGAQQCGPGFVVEGDDDGGWGKIRVIVKSGAPEERRKLILQINNNNNNKTLLLVISLEHGVKVEDTGFKTGITWPPDTMRGGQVESKEETQLSKNSNEQAGNKCVSMQLNSGVSFPDSDCDPV